MNNKTLRIFLALSVTLLLGIIALQYYWFKEAYNLEDKDFNQRVSNALRVVGKRMLDFNKNPNNMVLKPVERISSNYYTVQINDVIHPGVLEAILKQEFTRNDIKQNFEYAIYDCVENKIKYGAYVCNTANCKGNPLKYDFPQLKDYNYYFGVYFPEKKFFLLNQLSFWFGSSMVLLVVILFFSYSLLLNFKQKKLSEIQNDFINNMTHEFKTPISTISISSEVLMKSNIVETPERLLSYATIINREANRLKKNVDTVLQTTNISQKLDQLNLESVDIIALLSELESNIEPVCKEKKAIFIIENFAKSSTIRADYLHLTNVIHNLIDNSLKYCKDLPKINLTLEEYGNYLKIKIKDNGIGIAEQDIKQIFNKFFRVSTGNIHNVKGFGLGLYYVKEIIEAHKGNISVDSRMGEGSTFTICIPLAQE